MKELEEIKARILAKKPEMEEELDDLLGLCSHEIEVGHNENREFDYFKTLFLRIESEV